MKRILTELISNKGKHLAAFLFCIFAVTGVAHASTATFSFIGIPLTNTGTYNVSTNAVVNTWMNNTLHGMPSGASVVVTGAAAVNNYTGEGHVVGNTLAGTTGKSFLVNNNGVLNNGDASSSDVKMVFSGLTISQVSFSLEIFPDAGCPSPSNCPDRPDFELWAGTSTLTQIGSSWLGVDPSNGGGLNCKASSVSSCERAEQLGPTPSGNIALSNVTTLDFVDWPATIGIQNLTITYTTGGGGGTQSVPEPASLLLVVTGLGGVAAAYRRQRKTNRTI